MLALESKLDRRAVITLTAVALLIRLIGVNDQLWADEVLSLVRYVRRPLWDLYTHFYSNNQHPLYSLLARALIAIVGEHPWTIRLPAVVMGTACVPATYLLGSALTSRVQAFAAAALIAFSYHHVWFSQNARGYTAIMLAALVGTYFLVRGLRDERPRWFVGYGVVAGLGAYAHLGMVFIVVGQFLAVLPYLALRVRPVRRWAWPVAAFPMGAAFTIAFHGPMLPDVVDFFSNSPSRAVGLATPLWAALETVAALVQGFGGVAVIGGVVLAGVAVVGVYGAWSWARTDLLALGLFVLPALVTAAGMVGGRSIVYPRFFFGVAAFAVLIFMRGPFALAERFGKPKLGTAIAAFLVVASAASVPLNYLTPKQDFEGAMKYLEATRPPDEPVAALGIIETIYSGYYERDWPKVWSEQEIRAVQGDRAGIWLVFMFPEYIRHVNPEVMTFVKAACGPMKGFQGTLRGGGVYVCRLPAEQVR